MRGAPMVGNNATRKLSLVFGSRSMMRFGDSDPLRPPKIYDKEHFIIYTLPADALSFLSLCYFSCSPPNCTQYHTTCYTKSFEMKSVPPLFTLPHSHLCYCCHQHRAWLFPSPHICWNQTTTRNVSCGPLGVPGGCRVVATLWCCGAVGQNDGWAKQWCIVHVWTIA